MFQKYITLFFEECQINSRKHIINILTSCGNKKGIVMLVCIITIGIIFLVLVGIAVKIIMANNSESNKGCAGCPFKAECKKQKW